MSKNLESQSAKTVGSKELVRRRAFYTEVFGLIITTIGFFFNDPAVFTIGILTQLVGAIIAHKKGAA